MPYQTINRVIVGRDADVADFHAENDIAVLVGKSGEARTGTQGLSVAGAGGKAHSTRYGVAIVGPGAGGLATGGAGVVAYAFDGAAASGGDGAIACATRDGPASVGSAGLASVLDGVATGANQAVVVARRQNGAATAKTGQRGVAVVYTHPAVAPGSTVATAIADARGVAIAYDGNRVQGALGSVLVAEYISAGQSKLTAGIVDGVCLLANTPYVVNETGVFIKA